MAQAHRAVKTPPKKAPLIEEETPLLDAQKEGSDIEGTSLPELPLIQRYPTPWVPITGRIYLPSRGILYGDKLPGGFIEMKPMSTQEERILAGGGSNTNKVIDALFDRLFLTRSIHPKELLISDRMFCLLMVRSNAWGPEYGFRVKCPKCGQQFEKIVLLPYPGEPTVDELRELDEEGNSLSELIYIPEDDFLTENHDLNYPGTFKIRYMKTAAKEPFMTYLPNEKVEVGLRLLRGHDEDAIEKHQDRRLAKRKAGELGDVTYNYRMALHITSIDGKDVVGMQYIGERIQFVDSLLSIDSSTIKDTLEDWDSGLDTLVEIECVQPQCQWIFEEELPFNREFFRPRKRVSR